MNIQRTYSPTAWTVWRLPIPSMERDGAVIVSSRRKRKRRASVLVCGLERGAGVHELGKVCMDDAVALLDGIVAREDVLGVVVANLLKRGVFAVFGLAVVHHRHARLHVGIASIALAEYEVAFKRSDTPYACRLWVLVSL